MAMKRSIFIPPFSTWEDCRNVLSKALAVVMDAMQALPLVTDFKQRRLTNVGDPQDAQDAVTLRYLTTQLGGGSDASQLSGVVPAPSIPGPSTAGRGGVKLQAAVASQFITSIKRDGTVGLAQPAFTDISGTATAAQIPAATKPPATQNLVVGSRALNTVYQNTGTTPMYVCVSVLLTATAVTTSSVTAATDASNPPTSTVGSAALTNIVASSIPPLTFIVLPSNYYKVIPAGTTALQSWTEWV